MTTNSRNGNGTAGVVTSGGPAGEPSRAADAIRLCRMWIGELATRPRRAIYRRIHRPEPVAASESVRDQDCPKIPLLKYAPPALDWLIINDITVCGSLCVCVCALVCLCVSVRLHFGCHSLSNYGHQMGNFLAWHLALARLGWVEQSGSCLFPFSDALFESKHRPICLSVTHGAQPDFHE